MCDLSIILPTCNRGRLLRTAIESILAGTRCNYELIVVDGASTDDTAEVLRSFQPRLPDRLRVLRETTRAGFVKAANIGFRAARGQALCWLNDDARPLPGALDRALEQVRHAPEAVGLVAMFHKWHAARNVAYQQVVGETTFSLCHVRGTIYGNFPMGRRQVWEELGFLDERYVFCAADPDLSLAAWHAGYRVEPAWGACIDHDEHADDRRAEDHPRLQEDNRRLFEKWQLPPKNPLANDFDPARPCTLRGLAVRGALAA